MKTKVYALSKRVKILIVGINIILLLTAIVFNISTEFLPLIVFDLFVCAILLIAFFRGYFGSSGRLAYLKENWIVLLAGIPFDLLFSPYLPFNYLVFFKLIRVLLLMVRLSI